MSARAAGRRSVVVASGDRLFAEVVARYLEGTEGWSTVVAGDGVLALAAIQRSRPHAVVVLGDLPRLDGATLTRQIRRRWGDIAIVTVGGGAIVGTRRLPPDADGAALAAALAASAERGEDPGASDRPEDLAQLRTLTRREFAILRLLATGHETGEIARSLEISVHTVRTHMQNLYAKLGCHSRLDVVRLAARHGLLAEGGSSGSRLGDREGAGRRGPDAGP
jgi:DNA-binding NarL/FixJ family response regulator